MNDFGTRVKAAEAEISKTLKAPQNSKPRKAAKKVATRGSWKPGQSGNEDKKWKPGVSPNPGGRPKKTPITDAYRDLASLTYGARKSLKGLTFAERLALKQYEMAIEKGDMRAAQEIADRVEGKTIQVSQLQGPGGGAISLTSMTPEENERRIAELMAKGTSDGGDA